MAVAIPEKDLSRDNLFEGKLSCLQHRQGYRFSVDSILLAHFFAPCSKDRILDLGTGCGVISLILAYRWSAIQLWAVEIQPALAALAKRNATENDLADRMQVVEGDFRQLEQLVQPASFDWVVANPPYGKKDASRKNANHEKAAARHEIHAELADVVKAARIALKKGGKAAFIYPASRSVALINILSKQGLEPKRLQIVHSYPGNNGLLVLVEALAGGNPGLAVLPPFFIHTAPGGEYSPAMVKCYEP